MTIDEFLEFLAVTTVTWTPQGTGILRSREFVKEAYSPDYLKVFNNFRAYFCPITRVAYELGHGVFNVSSYPDAAEQLGLTWEDAKMIADVADGKNVASLRLKEEMYAACKYSPSS